MLISKITLKNFKSFGEGLHSIELNDLTALIGANSTGKTSLITALLRMFGQRNSERNLSINDFHFPLNTDLDSQKEINLMIEVKIDFPELEQRGVMEVDSIPDFIKHLIIEAPGCLPYVRMRLEGKWIQGPTPEGNIEQNMYYVNVAEGEDETEALSIVPLHHRSLIQMIYVPAMRDPSLQLKNVAGTFLYRLFRSVEWPAEFNEELKKATTPVIDLFKSIEGIDAISTTLNSEWNKYHREARYKHTEVIFNSNDLDSILKKVEIAFLPDEEGKRTEIANLGDGLKSLFYITLVSSLLEIESKMQDQTKPLLTILSVEEPENHISPHLLGRIISNLSNISLKENSQVIISSHNSSIIRRINPEDIRHLQMAPEGETRVNSILLPPKNDDSYKYVKEAVIAYPDLYFSRLVILGEGASEEIILPKLLDAFSIYPDDMNISIVPLGGKHVNHMWKLLNQLSIPYVTLLDFDKERYGGDWGRIKYALVQLHENGICTEEIRTISEEDSDDGVRIFSEEEIKNFHERKPTEEEALIAWIVQLEKQNIFFSYPLDIDFSMLKSFETAYKDTMTRGPSIDDQDTEKYQQQVKSAIKATLKSEKSTGTTYSTDDHELMIWYKSLFLGRGKPATHIEALISVEKEKLLTDSPPELIRLVGKVRELTS